MQPRSPGIDREAFAEVPRHWFGGNAVATHVANGVNLLFPAGERFFVRAVNHYMAELADDPELRAQVKTFFAQEGRHAKEHERFNIGVLEAHGFDVQRFLAAYERVAYGMIERAAPPSLRLATTAACEHFTAILAENALERRLIELAHPTMQRLLFWHAAEEIEHRSVAFDVLQRVAPGYGLRMAGLAMATACLGAFWIAATLFLLSQERSEHGASALAKDWRRARAYRRAHGATGPASVFVRGIREYMRRDFHPSKSDIDHLATEYLASAGLA